MIEHRLSTSVLVVCTCMAVSIPGCTNNQTDGDQFRPDPVCEAIVAGQVDRAMQLVKQGADVNANHGCALFAAAGRGQLELVKLLLGHKADPNRHLSGNVAVVIGVTPLQSAVISRKVQMVQMLLDGGANPRNDIDSFDVVINFGDVETAELLLGHGANANMADPLRGDEYASEYVSPGESRQVRVPRRDLESDRIDKTAKRWQCTVSGGESLLFRTTRSGAPGTGNGRERIAKLLLDHGADPNARTLNGATPLMMAASQHNHGVMKILLHAGADVKATDRCGRTAEEYAVLYPQHQRARLAPETKALLRGR